MILIVLILTCFLVNGQAWANIEIISGGHKYTSMDDYRVKRDANPQTEALLPQEQEEIEREAKKRGVVVDAAKVKTIAVKPKLSVDTQEKIEAIRADGQVDKTIQSFTQDWDHPQASKVLKPNDLEDKIVEAVREHKEPVLIMSDPKKMRIMAYNAQQAKKILNVSEESSN